MWRASKSHRSLWQELVFDGDCKCESERVCVNVNVNWYGCVCENVNVSVREGGEGGRESFSIEKLQRNTQV